MADLQTDAPTDHAPLLERAFEIDVEERSYRIANIEGEVPAFLRGIYYLNGPCRFGRDNVKYRHWLDGDGMVTQLVFDDEGVRFTNRFVRSTKWTEEEQAGKALFRTFGTKFDGDRLMRGIGLESPANVSVFPVGERLLAFGEQGLPWELDPETLETKEQFTFGRRINPISPFSAHPCFDDETGEMINFGISFASRQPCVHFYRFDGDGEMIYRKRVTIDHPSSVHDFMISPSYLMVYISPHVLDMEALMGVDEDGKPQPGEGDTLMESLRWKPELGSVLLVVDRENGEKIASVPIGEKYCLHLINAFEEDGRLIVDVIEMDRPIYDQYEPLPELFTDEPAGRPRRMTFNVETWELIDSREIDYEATPDFATIDPRRGEERFEDTWMLGMSNAGKKGRKFFDQLAHLSWNSPTEHDIYQAPPKNYLCGEPVFAEDPASENGTIICQNFDAEKRESSFLLFDAWNVAAGPIARLPLESPIPLCFHACYTPAGGRRS